MIIELTGLPGSGKTTFAKRLAEGGRFVLVRIEGRGELIYYNLLFLLLHPIAFARGLAWLWRYRGKRSLWYTKLMNLFFVHNGKYMKARKIEHAIIDQGHHQNVISLFDEEVPKEVLEKYIEMLPRPDLLCFLLADPETRTKRLHERGYGVRESEKGDDQSAWEEARERHFEELYIRRNTLPCFTETVSPQDVEQKLHKLSTKNPWYFIMHARMPTEKAHGLQIAKTVEALVRAGEYAMLWVPHRRQEKGSVAQYYDLAFPFPVRRIRTPEFLRLTVFLGSLAFWIDAAGFLVALAFARIPREAICLTRHAEIAWLLAKRGYSVFYEAHLWPASKRFLFKKLLQNVRAVVANSEGTAAEFRKAGFEVSVVPNGVDLELFDGVLSQQEARTEAGFPTDKTIIMYVGAFYAWKGAPFLLEAWRKHFCDAENVELVLVGGSEADLPKESRNVPHTRLVPHMSAAKVPSYLRSADILVLPNTPLTEESVRFTSPIKLFEYMASGRPIIASDLPSIRELVNDEMVSFTKAGDANDLAEKLSILMADRSLRERLAHAARREVHKYDWGERAKKLQEIARGI